MYSSNLIMAGSSDSWMSVREAAQYLGKSSHWLYQNRERLEIPAVAIGGTYRFEKSQLDRWISGNSRASQVRRTGNKPILKVTL